MAERDPEYNHPTTSWVQPLIEAIREQKTPMERALESLGLVRVPREEPAVAREIRGSIEPSIWDSAFTCSATFAWHFFNGKGRGREANLRRLKEAKRIVDYRRAGRLFQVIVKPCDKQRFSTKLEQHRADDKRGGSRRNASE